MTGKRWKIHAIKDRGLGLYDLIDTEKSRKYQFDVTDRGIRELVITLLNEQHEEIKKLKHLIEMLHMDFGITERNLTEENERLQQLLDYADDLIQSHLSEYHMRQWRNFKTGHKEYNDFWEEKLKKHNELKEDLE